MTPKKRQTEKIIIPKQKKPAGSHSDAGKECKILAVDAIEKARKRYALIFHLATFCAAVEMRSHASGVLTPPPPRAHSWNRRSIRRRSRLRQEWRRSSWLRRWIN